MVTARRGGTRSRTAERSSQTSLQTSVARVAGKWGSMHSQRQAQRRFSPQASYAPSMASTIPLQQMVPIYFQCPDGSQTSQPTETRYINMILPAQQTLMVATDYALSGLTSCPFNYANDIPLLPRPANLPILSNATGGSVECTGQRQV